MESEKQEEKPQQPIIIRRIRKIKKSGHHGGSWKIAYADFITAMMTFFLLMWLLSLLNKYQLEGVAEFFKKPLKEALQNPGNQRNKDKKNDKFSEKEKEKEKEKFKEKNKEKPNKVDVKQTKAEKQATFSDKITQLQAMKNAFEAKLEKDPELRQYKNQLNFIVTADGLKIQLHDLEGKSMFSTGKADFAKYSKPIISWLSHELNQYPNQVVIIGHTDAASYSGDQYTNWELSADRANATRRELIKFGMDSQKIYRVVGVGDKELLDKANGLDPANRRIEILILSDDALKKLQNNELK